MFFSAFSYKSINFNSTMKFDNVITLGGVPQRPFAGYLTDINIWSRGLRSESLRDFVHCDPVLEPPDLLQWEKLTLSWVGRKVGEKNLSKREICGSETESNQFLTFFDERLNMYQSLKTCNSLKGQLGSGKDFKTFADKIMALETRCNEGYWIPIIKKDENDEEFLDANTNNSVSVKLPWAEGQPNGENAQPCISTKPAPDYSRLSDIECNQKFCFACYLESSQIFRVKGTCMDGSDIDTVYTFKSDPLMNGKFMFQGISGVSVIRKLQNSSMWALMNGPNVTTQVATIETKPGTIFPIGVQKWSVSNRGGFCKDDKTFVNISLSKVSKLNPTLISHFFDRIQRISILLVQF